MIILLVLLIAAVILFPYIKRAVDRVAFISELKKLCALRRYRLKLLKPVAAIIKNFSDGYDLTVDTGDTVYAVKLWDVVYDRSSIVFGADRRVRSRRKIQDVFGDKNRKAHILSEREIGVFPNFKAPVSENRRTVCILAVKMSGSKMLYSDENGTRELCPKDRLYGMFVLPRNSVTKLFGHTK